MNVFQINIKLYLLHDIKLEDAATCINAFIDQGMSMDSELLELHNRNSFKNYVFDLLYPIETDKLYKKDKIYSLTIRTIDEKLARFYNSKLVHFHNPSMKGITSEIKIIPRKFIEKIYSITPIVIKSDEGYWKTKMPLQEFEQRIKINLIKKYDNALDTKIKEDFPLYTSLEFANRKPVPIKYKNITLLGDKLSLYIADDKLSQEIAYFSLGVGLGEMNARGNGMVNYRWF